MTKAFTSAKLAEQILRAMETGSATRLREDLDLVVSVTRDSDRVSPQEEEQREILGAIAEQMRSRGWPSEAHIHLLRHFAGNVQVCLS